MRVIFATHGAVFGAVSLKVPWNRVPMYNTIMGVAAGVGLLLVVWFIRRLYGNRPIAFAGWALAFGVVGVILFATGLHMTLTWPLAVIAPWDNIYFGEPSLAFGVLLGAAALYLWRRGPELEALGDTTMVRERVQAIVMPNSLFVFALGLVNLAISAFPIVYPVYAAPPQEPLTGAFSNLPRLESTAFAVLYFLIALGCVLFPLAMTRFGKLARVLVEVLWSMTGIALLLFSALNYFTHGGLVFNTV
jgi:uncharacterized membrane protein